MKLLNGRNFLYQWESGQLLIVPEGCTQVLFENGTTKNAIPCAVRMDGDQYVCDVPNDLLQTAAKIQAYGWDGSTVVAVASFVVQPRAKPDNYIYNQTDVLGVERAVQEALEELKATGQLPKGDKGDPGDPGYSPVRGVDYWTEADVATINDDIDAFTSTAKMDLLKFKVDIKDDIDAFKESVGTAGVFIAEYGVTIQGEMENTYNAGKMMFCKVDKRIFPLRRVEGSRFIFGYVDNDELTETYLFGSGWMTAKTPLLWLSQEEVNDIKTHINNFDEVIGDIETALDNIIAIQESLIGGGGE